MTWAPPTEQVSIHRPLERWQGCSGARPEVPDDGALLGLDAAPVRPSVGRAVAIVEEAEAPAKGVAEPPERLVLVRPKVPQAEVPRVPAGNGHAGLMLPLDDAPYRPVLQSGAGEGALELEEDDFLRRLRDAPPRRLDDDVNYLSLKGEALWQSFR